MVTLNLRCGLPCHVILPLLHVCAYDTWAVLIVLGIIRDITNNRVVTMVDTTIKHQTNGVHLWTTNNNHLIINSMFDMNRYCLKTLMVLILCYEKKLGWVLVKKNFFQMFFHFDHKHIEQPATIQRK